MAQYTYRSMQAARKIAELERSIRELKGTLSELDLQIQSEEVRTRIFNPAAPGYSSFCWSARQRREKLCTSIIRLEVELGSARRELAQVLEQAKSAPFQTGCSRFGRAHFRRTRLGVEPRASSCSPAPRPRW